MVVFFSPSLAWIGVSGSDITRMLQAVEGGDGRAFDRLLEAVYPALLDLARARLRRQGPGHTLDTSGLVHEAYLRLVRYQHVDWEGRGHFFGAASQTMRRILVDHARAKTADKRKGQRVTLSAAENQHEDVSLDQLIAVDEALAHLEEEHPRWVRVVECRYFGGLTIAETAAALGVSHGTVSNDWQMARAWLKRELSS